MAVDDIVHSPLRFHPIFSHHGCSISFTNQTKSLSFHNMNAKWNNYKSCQSLSHNLSSLPITTQTPPHSSCSKKQWPSKYFTNIKGTFPTKCKWFLLAWLLHLHKILSFLKPQKHMFVFLRSICPFLFDLGLPNVF